MILNIHVDPFTLKNLPTTTGADMGIVIVYTYSYREKVYSVIKSIGIIFPTALIKCKFL